MCAHYQHYQHVTRRRTHDISVIMTIFIRLAEEEEGANDNRHKKGMNIQMNQLQPKKKYILLLSFHE